MCCQTSGSAILSLERASRSQRVVHGSKFFLSPRHAADSHPMASPNIDENDSFRSTSQLLRDDSFKNSPLVTSKLSGSGSFKGQFTENTRRRCAVAVAILVLVALALSAHAWHEPLRPLEIPAHRKLYEGGWICSDPLLQDGQRTHGILQHRERASVA